MAKPILGLMPQNLCPAHFMCSKHLDFIWQPTHLPRTTHPACMHILLSCTCPYVPRACVIHPSASPSIHEDCANSSCLTRIHTMHSYYFQSEAGPQIEEQRSARRPEHHIIQLDPDPESTCSSRSSWLIWTVYMSIMNTSYHLCAIIISCFVGIQLQWNAFLLYLLFQLSTVVSNSLLCWSAKSRSISVSHATVTYPSSPIGSITASMVMESWMLSNRLRLIASSAEFIWLGLTCRLPCQMHMRFCHRFHKSRRLTRTCFSDIRQPRLIHRSHADFGDWGW